MARLVSEQTIDQVRSASDIVEVIGAVLPLKRRGGNFFALCPFHHEKSPSFAVNPSKQIFHCYGCHKGGNVFTFLQEYEGIGFLEAVQRLAKRSGIPLEFEQDPNYQKQRSIKDSLHQLHEQITQYWWKQLLESPAAKDARDYLERRGVTAEAIKQFRLGYAPNTWDDTVNWAKKHGYDLDMVEKGGLVIRRDRGGFYGRFRGRLMFPIMDDQGRPIGFSGRTLDEEKSTAKYVNSPETPLFNKAKVVYGLDKCKRGLLNANAAIVCEGQLDLITCYMAGVPNIVAPQGSALTAQHARLLRRYVEEVILCFDSDQAGQNAIVRSLDDLLASGLSVRVAIVPSPHDPDSYVKELGVDAFQQLIQSAVSFFDFYLDYLFKTHDARSDRGRRAIVRAMGEAAQKTGNRVLIDDYAQKTALKLGARTEAVRQEFEKAGSTQASESGSASTAQSGEEAEEPKQRPSDQELWLIKLLFAEGEEEEGTEWAAERIELEWLQHRAIREIVVQKLELDRAGRGGGAGALLETLSDVEARNVLTEVLSDDREIPHPGQQLRDLLQRLRNQYVDRKLSEIRRHLGDPDCTEDEIHSLLERQKALRAWKQQPIEGAAESGVGA